MDLKQYDNKCVRITTVWGEAFEGTASYSGREYVFHEYGYDDEALCITPILFYEDDISDVKSLEDVSGPFGHYSGKYGLLERKCLGWGTDMIEEIFDSDDDVQILRMLDCMIDNVQSLAERAIPGDAPWRSGATPEPEDENEQGPVYQGELEKMLRALIKCNQNDEVVQKSKDLLERLARR